LISQQRQYLQGFAFDKSVSLDGIFVAPYTITNTVPRDAATLTVPAFNPANLINAPAGATHFRLLVALAAVSDFAYNDTTGVYEPIDTAKMNFRRLLTLAILICLLRLLHQLKLLQPYQVRLR
jgi:hypothetical protein